ncbi:putative PASTA sensor protein [Actinobacteria bacterium OK074]|nr:putative PASTA sensor protein [Actinobacteria bacterium OK074]
MMTHQRGPRRAVVAFVAVFTAMGLLLTGCKQAEKTAAKIAVRAVARNVPIGSPFVRLALQLGLDYAIDKALALAGGTKEGNTPGLYGGTENSQDCDKAGLVRFLEDPANGRKAAAWAQAQHLKGIGDIAGFVRKLTPVLLRNDTLVKNHDYKKGKATVFEALLEAGIAVLVDQFGKPVVQCSCGNPLDTFEKSVDQADVRFDDHNRKWASYDRNKVTKVESSSNTRVDTYRLVNVAEPETGLAREAGSDGTTDEVLSTDPGSPSPSVSASAGPVPDVVGLSSDEAQQSLAADGFTAEVTEETSDTAEPGTVLAQSPAAGEEAAVGSAVTLTVAAGATNTATATESSTTDGGTDDNGGTDGGTSPSASAEATDDGSFFGGVTDGTAPSP